MIILDATTKSLQLKLGAAITTNQLPFSASYVDATSTTTTPGEQDGVSNSTTAVTVVSSPAASTQRLIKNIVIQNADTASAKVTIIYNNNSTLRYIVVATLAVGDQLIYEDGNGWSTIDTNGNFKTSGTGGGGGSGTVTTVSVASANGFAGTVANATTTPAITLSTSVTGVLKGNGTAISAATAGTDYQAPITLTTTGSSGAATFSSNTLNIPQYTGGGGGTVLPLIINGNLPSSITGTNTTASMTVSSGVATDSTNAAYISGAGYSWAASNGNHINGTDAASSTLANSTTYHMFLCSGGSGTGTFASASLTPTFPTGYTTYSRRIFSFNTNGSGAPIPYTAIETEGGSYLAWLGTQLLDINTSSQGTSRVAYALTVPSGIKVQPIGRSSNNSATNALIFTSGDETDVAPTDLSPYSNFNSAPGLDIGGGTANGWGTPNPMYLTTNTSAQIGARATTTSISFVWVTRGFKDWRRS